ncbi:unnamed protein product [Bursaphelenchus xylophilus]|uniref:(pine wood nematode) hypothetical protein n=1 Tax=Bursaphelenchus xylophilus TaxID=6326 RepID=A0A1I7SCM6_BURXY|nr:unnamed protein product [Bursaphelenchus xylophilus]CAG9093843.1 unnamed protein product [Bursaphelenchus xylophilus]
MAFQSLIALVLCFIASALFGSQFVPMRRFQPGDGMFAQWMMCIAIWFVGFGMFIWTGYQNFYPLAMLGGIAWAIANLMSIPIIGAIGLGQAVLLNSVTQCVIAFGVGTFGLLGTKARPADMMWLSLLGMVIVLAGGVLTSFVKGKPSEMLDHKPLTNEVHPEDTPPKSKPAVVQRLSLSIPDPAHETKFYAVNHKKKIIAMIASLVQGCLAAMTIVPVVAIQDHPKTFHNVEVGGMPYVFSIYCGILLTSTLSMLIYSAVKKNKPYVSPQLILPSMLTGFMWGIAQTMSIIATERLSQAVTGPITSMVPGCVATLWSLLYFKEIELGKNLRYLYAAITCTLTGAILIGLSKLA